MLNTILASQWRQQNCNVQRRMVIREQTDKPVTEPRRFMTHMESRTATAYENMNVPVTDPKRFVIIYDESSYNVGLYGFSMDKAYIDYRRRCTREGMRHAP